MPSYTPQEESARPQRQFTVDKGDYVCVVSAAEEKETRKGSDSIILDVEILGPKDGELFAEGTGPKFKERLIFQENTLWKIDAFRRAVGDAPVPGEEVEITAEGLEGLTFNARLGQESGYNDPEKKYMCVEYFIDKEGPF